MTTKININDLTISQVKEINSLLGNSANAQQKDAHPFEVGKAYLLRTVTMTIVGKLKAVYPSELLFSEASWVADSGRFHDTLKYGLLKQDKTEIEPFPEEVIVGRGSIIDCTLFSHELPKEQK